MTGCRYTVDRIEGLPPKKRGQSQCGARMLSLRELQLGYEVSLSRPDGLNETFGLLCAFMLAQSRRRLATWRIPSRAFATCSISRPNLALRLLPDREAPDCKPVHPTNAIAIVDRRLQAAVLRSKDYRAKGEPWYSIELVGD